MIAENCRRRKGGCRYGKGSKEEGDKVGRERERRRRRRRKMRMRREGVFVKIPQAYGFVVQIIIVM